MALKRTALKRKTPLRATRTMARGKGKTKYKSRERAFDYMGWVKSQRCIVRVFAELYASAQRDRIVDQSPSVLCESKCGGEVEADHMGERGLGRKALDATCVPICMQHHRERTDFSGAFSFFHQHDMRAFVSIAIQFTQNRARECGVEVPNV